MVQFVLSNSSRQWSRRVFDGLIKSMSKTRYGLLVIAITWAGSSLAATVKGQISSIGDTLHLEFSGLPQWDYSLNRVDKTRVELLVPAFDPMTEANLKTFDHPFVKKIEIDRTAVDGKVKISFLLKEAGIETFDYLTDDPSRLILDIYQQSAPKEKTPEVAQTEAKKPQVAAVAKKPVKTFEGDYKKVDPTRKPASDEILVVDNGGSVAARETADKAANLRLQQGVYDGGDPEYKRFLVKDYEIKEESIIASKQNIYLHFPMLKMPVSKFQELFDNRPEYEIKEQDSKENKEARLLLNLYNKNWEEKKKDRRYLFLKTYYYFTKQYPQSEYDEIIRNMAAQIYLDLWKDSNKPEEFDKARELYEFLVERYPDSPVNDRNRLLLAYADLERKDGISTLQRFDSYLSGKPNKEEVDQAKKALAEGYMILNKYDDALKVYKGLETGANSKEVAAEGSYRQGDVFFSQKKYDEAVKAYQESMKKHPGQEKVFPNAYFNTAESQFWLGDYKNAIKNYVDYLKAFPSGEYGGYAMTRIGELLDIMGADSSRSMGAYLECVFRYQDSPGAQIARVRMLSRKMLGMKEKELKKAIEEMDHTRQVVKLPKIDEFITLLKADGYKKRDEDQKALDELITYYQENATTTDLDFFRKRIQGLISNLLLEQVKQGNFLNAMQMNEKFQSTWLRGSDRMDMPYNIGRAYEQAGVFKEAEKIYLDIYSRLDKIKNTREDVERRVHEHLPTLEGVHLRLANTALNMRKYGDAHNQLKATGDGSKLTDEEKIEKVQIAASVAEARGDFETARRSLEEIYKNWKGETKLVIPVELRLAELLTQNKKYDEALKYTEQIEKQKAGGDELTDDQWARTLDTKGTALLGIGQQVAAVETYQQLLEQFESKRPLQSTRYKVGQILFQKGDLKGAERVWKRLDGEKDSLYRSLAQEKLKNAEWQDEYQRYIKRIPAMNEVEKE